MPTPTQLLTPNQTTGQFETLELSTAVAAGLGAVLPADLNRILAAAFDALPQLPADPSAYPAAGGLFRDGDANGYRIVRILPAS